VVKGNSVKFMPGAGPPMPERCPETGSGYLMGGPFWAEPIHDPAWLQGVLGAVKASKMALDPLQVRNSSTGSYGIACLPMLHWLVPSLVSPQQLTERV